MLKKRLLSILICTSLVLMSTFAGFNVFAQTVSDSDTYDRVYDTNNYENPYETDQIIVAIKAEMADQDPLKSYGLTLMKTLSTPNKEDSNQNIVGLYSITNRTAQGVIDAINTIKDNPAVAYAEPDYIITVSDTTPNDPDFSQLYDMSKIRAPKAWDIHTGTDNVVVGVIDTGIDYTHTDLQNNIWVNPGEIANNGIDDDNNGYIDDIHGWNFVTNTNDPMDDNGHGTHVSGTIGAVGNNAIGVVGVNWTTQLAALKFLSSYGSGSTSNAILAINYAANMNFDVCNNSWGGGSYSQSLCDAIASYNGVAVVAAGNNGTDNDTTPVYPANYNCSNIITVASTDIDDNKASSSCYGAATVDLGAPGVSIYSTYRGNTYATLSGTSMATPHVSGAAALLKSLYPSLTTAEIKARILANVDPVTSLNGITVTGGRLNVYECLIGNTDIIPVMTSNTSPSGVASASSCYESSSGIDLLAPWKAFDGEDESGFAASRWISALDYSMPQWISYGFSLPTYADSYYILPETGSCADRAPMNFILQGSNDNIRWTTLDSQSNITLSIWNNSGKTFSISNPDSYMTYRLCVTATNGAEVVAIQQLRLFGNSNPNLIPTMTSNNSPTGQVSSSSTYINATYEPWKAFDGDDESGASSRWISSSSGMPQWISYSFSQPTYAHSYYILPEAGSCADRAPMKFFLQGSNDNVNWTDLDSQSNITISIWNGSGKTFNISNPGSYRTYRLYFVYSNGSVVISIQKIKLY